MRFTKPDELVVLELGKAIERDHWRYTFAGMAMQALCGMRYDDEVARVAVKLADALLEALNEKE